MLSTCFITLDVDLGHLAEVVIIRFYHGSFSLSFPPEGVIYFKGKSFKYWPTFCLIFYMCLGAPCMSLAYPPEGEIEMLPITQHIFFPKTH